MAPTQTKTMQTPEPPRKKEPLEGEEAGTIEVIVHVQRYAYYEACRRLEVDIERKAGRDRIQKKIGHMVAFLVDKTVLTNDGQKGLWIEELLEQDGPEGDQTHELRFLAKKWLFTPTGRVKKGVGAFADELKADKIVFIDGFRIYDRYHQRGGGKQPMRMFLDLIPEIIDRDDGSSEPTATCFLSPARDAKAKIDNGKTDVQVEEGLIRAYGANGYEVWVQGDPNVENSETITGRAV